MSRVVLFRSHKSKIFGGGTMVEAFTNCDFFHSHCENRGWFSNRMKNNFTGISNRNLSKLFHYTGAQYPYCQKETEKSHHQTKTVIDFLPEPRRIYIQMALAAKCPRLTLSPECAELVQQCRSRWGWKPPE